MSFFCCLGGAGPAQTAKKVTRPAPKQQKKHDPAPSERVLFLLFGRVGVFIFLLFGPGACFCFDCWGRWRFFFFFGALAGDMFFFFFFLFGRAGGGGGGGGGLGGFGFSYSFFLLFGRGSFFFVCLGGVRVCFFLLCVFLSLFGRGTGVRSLTGLPGSSSSDPTTKKTKHKKKTTTTRVPCCSKRGIHKKKEHIHTRTHTRVHLRIVPLKWIEYGFGYVKTSSPYTPYSIYLRGTIHLHV